jgi:hypothetical protein
MFPKTARPVARPGVPFSDPASLAPARAAAPGPALGVLVGSNHVIMQRNNINPAIFQPFLESAANAGDKGEAQFLTPLEWGRTLSLPLPRFRPVIIDLSCGAGHLLQAAARESTNHLLGCDIDPCPLVNDKGQPADTPTVTRIVADVTKLYGLICKVDFNADCFVLNPP